MTPRKYSGLSPRFQYVWQSWLLPKISSVVSHPKGINTRRYQETQEHTMKKNCIDGIEENNIKT